MYEQFIYDFFICIYNWYELNGKRCDSEVNPVNNLVVRN